jgi:predicted Rossmann-fold nucleotide-binding protein
MKVIIAGGRDYRFTEADKKALDKLFTDHEFTEIVSGGARGADREGEHYAMYKGLPIRHFYAQWDRNGRGAGFIRNVEMAEYADALIAFPGRRGTEHMMKTARQHGLLVFSRIA